MKYFLRIMLVLVLAVAVVFGVYVYTQSSGRAEGGNANLTTVTKQPATEKGSDRILLSLVEDDKDRYELYKCGDDTILVHNGMEFVYHDWSKYITLEKPEMHIMNYDGDYDTNELAIRLVSSVEPDGSYVYDVYFIRPNTDENGEEYLDLYIANENAWHNLLTRGLKVELSQMSTCDKRVQFAVSYRWSNSGIKYDDDGIADCVYQAYACALKDGKGGYFKTKNWSFGGAKYYFYKNNRVRGTVDIMLNYFDTDQSQKLGSLYFEVYVNNKGSIDCRSKTMGFEPNHDYRILSPLNKAKKDWLYTEKNVNQSAYSVGDKDIDWLKYTMDFDPTVKEKRVSFADNSTEMKNVARLEFTSTEIRLYARKGYSFSAVPADRGDFKVVLNEGDGDDWDIAYKASVTKKKGESVLVITLDNAYPLDYFKTLTIYYNTES